MAGPLVAALVWGLLGFSQVIDLAGGKVTIEADHITTDLATRRVYLVGSARVATETNEFRADTIVIDMARPEAPAILADGGVYILGPHGEELSADRASYDLAAEGGDFEGLRLTVPLNWKPPLSALTAPDERPSALHLQARHASQVGDVLRLDNSFLTTSDSEPPQYSLLSERLEVTLGPGVLGDQISRVIARGARLQLYQTTLLGVSYFDLGQQGILLPQIGSNRTDGVFAQHEFAFASLPNTRITLTPRIGTEQFISGRARFAYGGAWGVFEVLASFRERHLLEVAKDDLQVSRLPELGYSPPTLTVPAVGGELASHVSYGRIDESDNTTAWRAQAEADYTRPLHEGATSRLGLRLGARYAAYDPGTWYGALWAGIDLEKQFPYWFYNRIELTSHLIGGATPFRFDEIEIPTELVHEARLRFTRHWIATNLVKVDLNDQVLRRWQVGLSFRDGDLEYGVRMLTRPGFELLADARIVGF